VCAPDNQGEHNRSSVLICAVVAPPLGPRLHLMSYVLSALCSLLIAPVGLLVVLSNYQLVSSNSQQQHQQAAAGPDGPQPQPQPANPDPDNDQRAFLFSTSCLQQRQGQGERPFFSDADAIISVLSDVRCSWRLEVV
jgi:hypothetical protein